MLRTNSGVFPFTTDDHKGRLRFDHQLKSEDRLFPRLNATGLSGVNYTMGRRATVAAGNAASSDIAARVGRLAGRGGIRRANRSGTRPRPTCGGSSLE